MSKRTPLHDRHVGAGGQMVPFGGWDMPLHYGSQLEEHHRVRRDAGIFDVSHMLVVDVAGADATAWLRRLLANDVARLVPGQALYSCMLNEEGGVIDDLIAYRRVAGAATPFRVIVNAGTSDKDLAWMSAAAAGFDLALQPRRDLVMLAVQGPRACERAAPLLPESLRAAALALEPFHAAEAGDAFVGRTGYTGEDGWEVLLPAAAGLAFWDAALAVGIAPCGLGARDTLRLEAGMNLYGQDMDEATSPLVSGLAWTVAWEPAGRAFIGRGALERERAAGPAQRLAGLVLGERGVMRRGQRVVTAAGDGLVTSGGFSPTMNCSIALARVPVAAAGACEVEIRGALRPARLLRPPFVRHGRVLVS
ncbi:MAG: glycine cleavage system aminomethyltransferase GcvT [Gammaproteobacteria bacterium]|nr:glycine cleavage system aminomethyltransferase GcvT [Gammaproteobacteria bacterium]